MGAVEGETHYIGTPAFIRQQAGVASNDALLESLRAAGATVVLLASRQDLLAAFTFGDELRPQARALVDALKRQGKQVLLLTGDHAQVARRVGAELGIDNVAWELSPADKLARVNALQDRGAVVAMIGDGVNDAPVLAGASVSVAIGGAADVAVASADMILLSPGSTPWVRASRWPSGRCASSARTSAGRWRITSSPYRRRSWVTSRRGSRRSACR